MAKKTSSKPSAQKTRAKKQASVEVRGLNDVIALFNRIVAKNIHDRYNARFSENTRKKIVAYGPWLSIALLLVAAPILLVLANDGILVSPIGFLEKVLFNRDSWVLLILVFINVLSAVDALEELFKKTIRGWNRVYVALLINTGYVIYQLFSNLDKPAAPLLSLIAFVFCMFALFDVKEYYK
jgi:hypothetical protein